MESSKEKLLVWRGVLWVWMMEDEVSEHSITFCWKMPASNVLNRILWVQEDERRARIVIPAEKNYGCSKY
jgi:hypothetical protein